MKDIYTPKEVIKIIEVVIQSVIGKNKNTATVKEVKALVDLLEEKLIPIKDYMSTNVTKIEALEVCFSIISAIRDFNNQVRHTSTRMETLLKKVTDQFIKALFLTEDKVAVENQVKLLFREFHKADTSTYYVWWRIVKAIDQEDNAEYLELFIKELFAVKDSVESDGVRGYPEDEIDCDDEYYDDERFDYFDFEQTVGYKIIELNNLLLDCLVRNDLFKVYYKKLTPIESDEQFNGKLVRYLKVIDLECAEGICIKILTATYSMLDYFEVRRALGEIQLKLGKTEESFETVVELFSEELKMEDYKFLSDNFGNTEALIEFKRDIKERLYGSHLFGFLEEAYFEILHLDKEYDTLLEKITPRTNMSLVFKYADHLYEIDAKVLLDKVMSIGDGYGRAPKNKEELKRCLGFVLEHYSNDDILKNLEKYSSSKESLNLKLKEAIQ